MRLLITADIMIDVCQKHNGQFVKNMKTNDAPQWVRQCYGVYNFSEKVPFLWGLMFSVIKKKYSKAKNVSCNIYNSQAEFTVDLYDECEVDDKSPTLLIDSLKEFIQDSVEDLECTGWKISEELKEGSKKGYDLITRAKNFDEISSCTENTMLTSISELNLFCSYMCERIDMLLST